MSLPRIIVNADDFGKDALTNRRIMDCFARGLISSATVMANMPGFYEVAEWYAAQTVKPKLGIHLNLDEGQPLSEEFRATYQGQSLFYRGGLFRCGKLYLHVIRQELKAQIEKMRSHHIKVGHIDSHHHLHERWPIARIAVSLAQEYQIHNIRMAFNLLSGSAAHKTLYRYALNRCFFKRCLNIKVKLSSTLDCFMATRPDIGGETIELMVHPGTDEDYALLMSEEYASFLEHYQLTSYPDR